MDCLESPLTLSKSIVFYIASEKIQPCLCMRFVFQTSFFSFLVEWLGGTIKGTPQPSLKNPTRKKVNR